MLKSSWLKRLFIPLIVIFLLSVPALKDLFGSGYYTSHDGEGHVIRMDEFYQAALDGQIPVRWSKRLYFGYGYPFFNFNYPAIYYFGVPLMAVGVSAADAMKAETIIMYLASGLLMYGYLRRKVQAPFALSGAILYLYAPYRLLNIYVRGSVAESAAFFFPPLLLWTAELIAEKKPKAILWAAVVLFLLGISHNISALLLFGFFFVYLLFLSYGRRSLRPFLSGVVSFILGLMMSAFFFIPALAEKKLTFLDQTIARDYPDHFVYLIQLIRGGWGFGGSGPGPNDGLSFNLGWVQLAIVVVGTAMLFLSRKRKAINFFYHDHFLILLSFTVTILVGAIFFMLSLSKVFWDHLPLLPFVQFPWRFLLLTVPTLSVMSAVLLQEFAHFYRWGQFKVLAVAVIVIGVAIFLAKDQWHINQVLIPQTVAGDALLGTTTWADEQATQWFLPKPNRIPDQKVEFLGGEGQLAINSWKTAEHIYQLSVAVPTAMVENTMYYPGWQTWVDEEEVIANYQDPRSPGRLVYEVGAGQHQVVSRFRETPSRRAVDVLSLVTMIGVSTALVWPAQKRH